MYKEIKKCRLQKSPDLISVLNLGNQYMTGIFPKSLDQHVHKCPLELVWCKKSNLLQLKHTYDLGQMYGDNYGYRSGLNKSMVEHIIHPLFRILTVNKSLSSLHSSKVPYPISMI